MAHLSDLERLRDGWDGPGSKAIPTQVFANYATLVAAFDSRIPSDLEPTARGNGAIVLEWERGRLSFTAELEPDGGMWLCRLNLRFVADDEDHQFSAFDAAVVKQFYDTGHIPQRD